MPLQIDIPDDEIKYLTEPAKEELASSTKEYINELIKEASRLEEIENTTGREPEIVGSMVRNAVLLLKKDYRDVSKSRLLKFIQFISALSSALFGVMFDYEQMANSTYLIFVFIVFAIAIASTLYVIIKE